ncbi:MAG: hypothetical protein UU47_C0010G0004 [candidate division TM6 bacterium GW2011_GWE2_41_16]|nr:MAG: hypothetical protein UU47_C0010G0004 [candidate division TM6 bacterium GW2011_GWE2_41_16]
MVNKFLRDQKAIGLFLMCMSVYGESAAACEHECEDHAPDCCINKAKKEHKKSRQELLTEYIEVQGSLMKDLLAESAALVNKQKNIADQMSELADTSGEGYSKDELAVMVKKTREEISSSQKRLPQITQKR